MVGATTRLYNKGFSASEVGPSLQPSTQWMRPRTTNCFASVAALDNGRGRVTEKQAFKQMIQLAQLSHHKSDVNTRICMVAASDRRKGSEPRPLIMPVILGAACV